MKLYIYNCHFNATVSNSILTYVLQTPTASVDAIVVAPPPSLHPLMNARPQVCSRLTIISCILLIYRFRLQLLRLHLLGLHLLRLRLSRLFLPGLPLPPSLRLLSLPTHSLSPPSHLLARLLPPLYSCAIAPLQWHNHQQQHHLRPCLR